MQAREKIKLVQVIAEKDAVGGGPKHVLGILSNIDHEKFDLFLICPKGELSRRVERMKRIEVIEEDMDSKFSIGTIFRIRKELQKIQAEDNPFAPMIVHSHGPRAGLLARKALPAGVISVYTEHIWGPGYHIEDRINEWMQKKILRTLNNRTNLIIAVSKAVRDYLFIEHLSPEERTVVIPNGITMSNVKCQMSNVKRRNYSNQIIGNIGSLNKIKGQAYLIEAMAEVIKSYPHAMLEIVGEGEERDNIKNQISNLKLDRHVTLLGRRDNVKEIMQRWTVYAQPSIAETFGITILEAYADGLPVVASNVSGISELITDKKTGLLVPSEDSSKLADAIIKLLDHPAEAAKLARGGKERVKEYEWRKVIVKLEESYLKLVKRGK